MKEYTNKEIKQKPGGRLPKEQPSRTLPKTMARQAWLKSKERVFSATKTDPESSYASAQEMEEQGIRQGETLLEDGAAFALGKAGNSARRHFAHGHKPNQCPPREEIREGNSLHPDTANPDPKTAARQEQKRRAAKKQIQNFQERQRRAKSAARGLRGVDRDQKQLRTAANTVRQEKQARQAAQRTQAVLCRARQTAREGVEAAKKTATVLRSAIRHLLAVLRSLAAALVAGGWVTAFTESRMRAARLLQQHGVRVKGHPLCWHTACADWLMQYDNKTILQKQLDRIQREVSNFKGVVDMWDVINEVVIMPVYRSDNAVSRICRYLGPVELVRQVFAAAKQANPQATLLINDFNLSDKYRDLIATCLDAGVPISAIGLQTHQHQGYMGRERLEEILERFSVFGLPLHFTENTLLSGHLMPADIVDLNDYQVESWPSTPEGEERQRREWREMYEILFSHPQVEAITGWDFADGAWLNAPSGLLRADNSPKPSYRELQRLIHEEWTSQGELHTDENGVAELAGFRETYSLHTDRAQAEVQLTAQPITQPRRILLQDCHI